MVNAMDVGDRYVAIWNEPSADQRRKRICSLWAPDGTTCYRLLDARGYGASEARVTSSWDKWAEFLVFAPEGRIRSDYQFNPTISEANELVDRYVAVWNEPNVNARCSLIAELWAPDGGYINETTVWTGHSAIEAEMARVYNKLAAKDLAFSLANHSQAHHNVVSLGWHTRAKDSEEVKAVGSDLLIIDEGGRIRLDYRYGEPPG